MLLTPNDVGILVEHPVWQRGKVIEIISPYAIIHFPSLASSPQGPQRKLREDAAQLTKSSVQSDPGARWHRDRARQAEEGLEAQGQGPAERPRRRRAVVRGDAIRRKFDDEKFVDNDLRNKRAAAEVFQANFGEGRGAAMVDAGKHAEIASDARRHLPRHQHPVAVRSEGRAQGVREGG